MNQNDKQTLPDLLKEVAYFPDVPSALLEQDKPLPDVPVKQFTPEEQEQIKKLAMNKAVADFHSRPANLRNPEAKKVKCPQCSRRMTMAEFRQHKHVIYLMVTQPSKKGRRRA